MNTTSKKNNNNSPNNQLLVEAFIRLFNASLEEIEVQEKIPGASVLVFYKELCYQVDTHVKLRQDAKDMLQDERSAFRISPDIWIQAAGDEYTRAEFYIALLQGMSDQADFNTINTAINVASFSENGKKAFWFALATLDHKGSGDVYPKAIVTAAKLNDIEVLMDDLLKVQIKNGINFFNLFVEGMFEEVRIKDDNGTETSVYIYSQNPDAWDFHKDN